MNHRLTMKIKWKYERRKIDELQENPYNPRRMSKHKAEKLKWSLEKYGQCEPIVIQPDGKIISGHQRIKVLRSIGAREVDVSTPERFLTKEEEQKLLIGLNKIRGEFDDEMLANHFDPNILLEAGFLDAELTDDIEPKKKQSTYSINLKFRELENLRFVEDHLRNVLENFPCATMKVKDR